MTDQTQMTATSHSERRAMRGRRRRFEDQAAAILQTHSSRLDIHRRSVTLFYLLFGLVVGFVLGLAGAKGVLAAESQDAVFTASDVSPMVVLSEGTHFSEAKQTGGPVIRTVMNQNFLIPTHGGMEAAHLFPLSDGAAVGAVTSAVEERLAGTPMKPILMALLAAILVVTVSLTVTFWRHLNTAYAPKRKIRRD